MEQPALTILNARRIMAVSTLRPDGWPQTTIVGYANSGFTLYFLIHRSSQKFCNIEHEPRISIAVGEEPRTMSELQAVYAGAMASEVSDPAEIETAWKLLTDRHPNQMGFESPDRTETAMIRAGCKYVSVLDFTQGPGHSETLTIGEDGRPIQDSTGDGQWGSTRP